MTTQGYANPDILVEGDWLEGVIDDPNIRIVDCDPYDAYGRAHIRNAVGIPVHHYIKERGYDDDPRGYPLVAPPRHDEGSDGANGHRRRQPRCCL